LVWLLSSLGAAQQPAAQQSSATPAEFTQARKLMQQGKLAEAIAELQTLEASAPDTRGLALDWALRITRKATM